MVFTTYDILYYSETSILQSLMGHKKIRTIENLVE